MKKTLLLSIAIICFTGACIITSSCKNKSKSDTSNTSDSTIVDVEEAENMAFCTWSKISVRQEPKSSGKWLTSVYLAEKFEYLDESVVDSSDKKLPTYHKIKLKDGTEGWIRSEYVELNARPAAMIQNTPIYNRPDIMTKSEKEFYQMDVVAVMGQQDDWLEVKGKPRDYTWYRTGWIKADNVTYDRDDIGVAVFALRAFEQKDEAKMQEELEAILENPDFEQSIFINDIYNMFNDASMVRLNIDFSHFPSSQIDMLTDYFLFEEVDLKAGVATISDEGMKELVSQALNEMSSTSSRDQYDFYGSTIKINYFTSVFLSLPYFLPEDDRANGYYANLMDDASNEERLFAFLMYKLDRSPNNIQRLFDTYKDFAYSKLSSTVYKGSKLDETVDGLISTYDFIKSFSDYKTMLEEIYDEVQQAFQENKGANDGYGIYPLYNQWSVYEPIIDPQPLYEIDQLWMTSFWVRRHAEGNDETVYKILKEIQKHYK